MGTGGAEEADTDTHKMYLKEKSGRSTWERKDGGRQSSAPFSSPVAWDCKFHQSIMGGVNTAH